MNLQVLVVTILVSLCFFYASCRLMPDIVKTWLTNCLLHLPLPAIWISFLKKTLQKPSACDCSGCDTTTVRKKNDSSADHLSQAPVEQRLVFHPRKK